MLDNMDHLHKPVDCMSAWALLLLKEYFTRKKNIFRKCNFSITSLPHQWILCIKWVPSEQSKQLIKTFHFKIHQHICFGLFSIVNGAWSVHISLLIQTRPFFHLFYFYLKNMQLFTSQDVDWWTGVAWITCGLLWCFCHLFELSVWRHPFTAEDSLKCK